MKISIRRRQTYQLSDSIFVQISDVVVDPIFGKNGIALHAVCVFSLAALLIPKAITSTREWPQAEADGVDPGRVAPLLQVVAVATRVAPAFNGPVEWDESEFDAPKVVPSCGTASIRVQTAALNATATATAVVVESGIDSSGGGSEAKNCRKDLHLVDVGRSGVQRMVAR